MHSEPEFLVVGHDEPNNAAAAVAVAATATNTRIQEPVTRKDKFDHVVRVLGLREECLKYLKDEHGFDQVRHLEMVNDAQLEAWMDLSGGKLTAADAITVRAFQAWCHDYRKKHGGSLPLSWSNDFTEDIFDNFAIAPASSVAVPMEVDPVSNGSGDNETTGKIPVKEPFTVNRPQWFNNPKWVRFRLEGKGDHRPCPAKDIPEIAETIEKRQLRRKELTGESGPKKKAGKPILRPCMYCSMVMPGPGDEKAKLCSLVNPDKDGKRTPKACNKCHVFLCVTSPDGGKESCFERWHSMKDLPVAPGRKRHMVQGHACGKTTKTRVSEAN